MKKNYNFIEGCDILINDFFNNHIFSSDEPLSKMDIENCIKGLKWMLSYPCESYYIHPTDLYILKRNKFLIKDLKGNWSINLKLIENE